MSEKMNENTNALNWFEIPASDLARATKFYESIFDVKMLQMEMDDIKMSMFPTTAASGKSGGGIAQSTMHKPSKLGSIIYLNANPDLQLVLDRVTSNGGKITLPKTGIGPNGFMAFVEDTEGNTVGLHSNN